jgi:hypothetical protein
MNIITGIRSKGGGFYWHNDDNISRWSATIDLIPEPKEFSDEYKDAYYIKDKNRITNGK